MANRIHLDGNYEGRELSIRAHEVEGGFKLVSQLARKLGQRTWTLVKIESPDKIHPSRAAAHAASKATLKMSIDGGFA
ncbi:hypothetical protein CFB50_08425 [Burkholderia sp. AU33423]|uniref:hypothetical protein n=1 Tax=Burkholderia sp. AU33423 TaxID=2015355 RepID=UPI000B7A8BAF|nr:hypothetical protein [Burkholderia sp. AU33423]OXI88521.1 hypothetical protein CFB50_08425 [Burkholderia sp. AU33423]